MSRVIQNDLSESYVEQDRSRTVSFTTNQENRHHSIGGQSSLSSRIIKETSVDFPWTSSRGKKKRIMLPTFTERPGRENNIFDDSTDASQISEFCLQESLGHNSLFHNVSGYMKIVCIGHPFLYHDTFISQGFMKKYNIKMDGMSHIFGRESPIMQEVYKFVNGIPKCGGDAMKTAEAAQWIMYYPKSVTFMGSVGGDLEAQDIVSYLQDINLGYKLEEKTQKKTSYQIVLRDRKTNWTEAIVIDENASRFSVGFLDKKRLVNLLEAASIIFIGGRSCIMTDMPLTSVAYYTNSQWKTLVMQLCEGMPLTGRQSELTDIMKFIDILLISKKTALMLITLFQLKCFWKSPRRIASCIHRWLKSCSQKQATVLIYDSIKTAYIVVDEEKKITIKKYKSNYYSSQNIVDLYGCESALSGGYIAQLAQSSNQDVCIDCGFFCAAAVATQHGAGFPIDRLSHVMKWKIAQVDDEVDDEAIKNRGRCRKCCTSK